MKSLIYKTISSLVGFATLWLQLTANANAQVLQPSIDFLPTPPDQGAPNGRQRGGASRGDCLLFQDLTAIVPRVEGIVWSQTTREFPQFFFQVPAELTTDIPLEFVIQDSNDDYAVRQQFSVNAEAGLLPVAVLDPAEQLGLALGETYSWTFAIYCD